MYLQPLTLFSQNETLHPPAGAKEQLQASCQAGHIAQCVEARRLPTERMLSPRPSPSPQLTQLLREEEEKEEGSRERMAQVLAPHIPCLGTYKKRFYCLHLALKYSTLGTVIDLFISIHILGLRLVNLNRYTHFRTARSAQSSPPGSYQLGLVETQRC